MSSITFQDIYSEFNQSGNLSNLLVGYKTNGVTMFLVLKNVVPTPTSDLVLKVECRDVETSFELADQPGINEYGLNPADSTVDAPYISAMYQIAPYGDSSTPGFPVAPQGNYSAEVKLWFESKSGAYEHSDTCILKFNVTEGDPVGTITFVSSVVEPYVEKIPLTDPVISVENNTVTITQAESAQIWYTTDGKTPTPGTGTQLANIAKGLPYVGMSSGELSSEGITGTEENLFVDLEENGEDEFTLTGGVVSGVIEEDMQEMLEDLDNVPDGTYKSYFVASGAIINSSKLDLTHNYYISFSSENPSFYPSLIQYSAGGKSKFYRKTGNRYSLTDLLSNFIIESNDSVMMFYLSYLVFVPAEETPSLDTLKATNLIFVDVTANQKYFNALGYTTEEEIQSYLDTVSYEDFTVWTEEGSTPGIGAIYESPFPFSETLQIKAVATDTSGVRGNSNVVYQEVVPEVTETTPGPFVVKKISQLPFTELSDNVRILVQENGDFKQIRGSEFQKIEELEPEQPEGTGEIDPELMAYIRYGSFINNQSITGEQEVDGTEHFLRGIGSPLVKSGNYYTMSLSYGVLLSSNLHKESWLYRILVDTENILLKDVSVKNVILVNGTTENLNESPTSVSDVFISGNYLYARFQLKENYNFNLVRTAYPPSSDVTWETLIEEVQFVRPINNTEFFLMKETIEDSGVYSNGGTTLTPISSLVSGLPFSTSDSLLGSYCITDKGIAIDLQCTEKNSSAILFSSDAGDSWQVFDVHTDSVPYIASLNYGGGWYYRMQMDATVSNTTAKYLKSKDLKEWTTVFSYNLLNPPEMLLDLGVGTENFYLGNKGYLSVPAASYRDQINFPPLTKITTIMNSDNQLYYYEGYIYTIGYNIENSSHIYDPDMMKVLPCIAYKKIE